MTEKEIVLQSVPLLDDGVHSSPTGSEVRNAFVWQDSLGELHILPNGGGMFTIRIANPVLRADSCPFPD